MLPGQLQLPFAGLPSMHAYLLCMCKAAMGLSLQGLDHRVQDVFNIHSNDRTATNCSKAKESDDLLCRLQCASCCMQAIQAPLWPSLHCLPPLVHPFSHACTWISFCEPYFYWCTVFSQALSTCVGGTMWTLRLSGALQHAFKAFFDAKTGLQCHTGHIRAGADVVDHRGAWPVPFAG